MAMKPPHFLIWIHRDLRLSDHPALAAAAARGTMLPVFLWCPEEEGDWAPGAAARWWLHHSLASLQKELSARRLPLVIRRVKRSGPALEDYPRGRDLPDRDGTSRLSAHLAFGEVSPRQVYHAAPGFLYRKEIGWRDFARYVLFHFPTTIEKPLRPEFRRFAWLKSPHLKAWQKGMTGYPIVDAGMRQLWATGWMHNRVRMIVASFLVKDLLVSWTDGAAWFWDTLVDADLASNTFNWQWTGAAVRMPRLISVSLTRLHRGSDLTQGALMSGAGCLS